MNTTTKQTPLPDPTCYLVGGGHPSLSRHFLPVRQHHRDGTALRSTRGQQGIALLLQLLIELQTLRYVAGPGT